MDGVIIDHTANKIALARSFGITLAPSETHSEILPTLMQHDDYIALQNHLYGGSDLALSAPLFDGALETLSYMRDARMPFVLITRRRNPEHAIALLNERGLWGEIFTEKNTFFVDEPEEKNVVGLREGVTHFFDDERRVLRVMQDIPERFLVDTHRLFDDESQFPRVFDWGMVRDELMLRGA